MLSDSAHLNQLLRVNVRPQKWAIFLRENDKRALNVTISVLSNQWGGIRCLIIPVREDGTISNLNENLLRFHEPEQFVHFLPGREDGTGQLQSFLNFLRGLWPYRELHGSIFYYQFWRSFVGTTHTLEAVPDRLIQQNELYTYSAPEQSQFNEYLPALFGIPDRTTREVFQRNNRLLELAISPDGAISSPDSIWARQFDNKLFSSPVNLTGYEIVPYEDTTAPMEDLHFDIILANSLTSICMFWNIRATRETLQLYRDAGRRTFLLPIELCDSKVPLQTMVNFIREHFLFADAETNLHIRFWAEDLKSQNKLRKAIQQVDGLEEFGKPRKRITSESLLSMMNLSPDELAKSGVETSRGRSRFGLQDNGVDELPEKLRYAWVQPWTQFDRPILYSKTAGHYKEGVDYQAPIFTSLADGLNRIHFTAPDNLDRAAAAVFDIECEIWNNFPKHRKVAHQIREGSWFSRYGISFPVSPGSLHSNYVEITLPTGIEALETFFGDADYSISVSQNGKYATAMIELVGGMRNLGLLASKPIYLLLDALAPRNPDKLAGHIGKRISKNTSTEVDFVEEIKEALQESDVILQFNRNPRTLHELQSLLANSLNRPISKSQVLSIIKPLSERQVLKRGFHLRCPNCGTLSWYPLMVIEETVTCTGCQNKFLVPVEQPTSTNPNNTQDQELTEIQLYYALNTLVDRIMDQDGLPTLLTLHHLIDGKQVHCLVPGLDIHEILPNGTRSQVRKEFDFIFVDKSELHVGECKAGKGLYEKDYETARFAARLGIHHFYFCTISEFTDITKQEVQELRAELENYTMSIDIIEGDRLLGESL